MVVTMKLLLDVVLGDESEALEVLNKSLDDDFDDEITLHGCVSVGKHCHNLIVKEIVVDKENTQVELYKSGGKTCTFIKTSKKEIELKDIVIIKGNYYIVVVSEFGINLYSNELSSFYFKNNLKSIQEINSILLTENVTFEIFKALL